MIWVTMSPGNIEKLASRLAKHPYCRFVAALSGTQSLALNVAVPRLQDLISFVDTELSGQGVISQEIVPMERALKRGSTIVETRFRKS